MNAKSSPAQIRHARLDAAVRGLRGAVWQADPATVDRHRSELGEVWARVDDLLALLGDPYAPPRFLLHPPGSPRPPDA